jgi:hypothetical protein
MDQQEVRNADDLEQARAAMAGADEKAAALAFGSPHALDELDAILRRIAWS